MTDLLHRILPTVQKPARYVGGEYRQVIKNKEDVSVRVAFCFPDTYEIGMSNLGMRILYGVMNALKDVWCERVFMPWGDMAAAMREHRIPLYALESKDPVKDFDLVTFTIGYEMSYTNIVQMLLLAGIEPLAKDRHGLEGIVFAGGTCVYNPEPLADFFDFFSLGEGEDVTVETLDLYRTAKAEGWSKERFLHEIAKLDGIYVPSLYEHTYGENGDLAAIRPLDGAPEVVTKRIVQDFDSSYYPTDGIVPSTEIVHDRANLEVFRGCIRGCRFCQAGFCYRPVRPRSAETLLRQAREILADSGFSELTLASLSTSDYKQLEQLALPLIDHCEPRMVNLSLPSLRADNFSRELMEKVQTVRKSGLTFAPEAGTQRLRDAINKNVTEDEILTTCATAFSGGWNNVKLYFMLGLPTETDEDVLGITDLVYKIIRVWKENAPNKKRPLSINLATAFFVPKPFTPFQWEAQITPAEYERRVRLLKDHLHTRYVDYRYHGAELSFLEAVLARGDRRLAPVLLEAAKRGAQLDAWNEYFRPDLWREAFDACGVDPAHYAQREFGRDETLPWDTLSVGIRKEFFWRERERAYQGKTTPSCRERCAGCGADALLKGGVCDT
ncbi:MAG: TIGR03960 family B12-binding radical SAM protein [Oscillospiraceae bacterium]|nr:TIGR03960 family B12-binding radical SAM protein [Oscillospiraceae bacterium]